MGGIRTLFYALPNSTLLWLDGLLPGVDPRTMTARDVLRAALAYVRQEMQAA